MEYVIYIWLGFAFVLGAAVGSWLNVCIYRIPFEKSLLWPGSRCGFCLQAIRWYDNIPLLSYWLLRGRCRTCKQSYSARYFLIELFTGLVFAGILYLDVIVRLPGIAYLDEVQFFVQLRYIPLQAWGVWLGHVTLASLLIVTSFTDLDHMEIPLSITVTGTILGLLFAALFPWPWPNAQGALRGVRPELADWAPLLGYQPWPLWRPSQLPTWLAPGSWQLGLANGLAGVLAGMVLVRVIRFLFGMGRGVEGLGLGDADLMMMAGAFLGWQATLIAFFVSVFPALVLAVFSVILRGSQAIPFGPSLALGILLTLYGWRWIGPYFAPLFFDGMLLSFLAITGSILLLLVSFLLRVMRGVPVATDPPA